jgi:hypothetical protein
MCFTYSINRIGEANVSHGARMNDFVAKEGPVSLSVAALRFTIRCQGDPFIDNSLIGHLALDSAS